MAAPTQTSLLCPHCGAPAVQESLNRRKNSISGMVIGGLVIATVSWYVFWPFVIVGVIVFILGLVAPKNIVYGATRECNQCGYSWVVTA